MYSLVKKILFWFDPEEVHYWVMDRLETFCKVGFLRAFIRSRYCVADPSMHTKVWGINFPNPVGLAAGFDKDARFIDSLQHLGFGFIEIGTVTPRSQTGNPKPRLFRLVQDQAIINRMGFNNRGVIHALQKLKKKKGNMIIGGNIGKNKDTPNERANADYIDCFHELYKIVDYYVVNVSSPNTPGLRALQEKEPLMDLLQQLQQLNLQKGSPKPILLKIAPDLTDGQLDDIIEIVKLTGIDGIVATNTTISREGLYTDPAKVSEIGAGGLSGAPLKARSTEVIRYIHQHSGGTIPMIAVGGIFTAEDAQEKLEAGAKLVQVYTGFIYEGPSIVKKICKGLMRNGYFAQR